MAHIRLSEELQKQLKDGSVSDEAKRLFQDYGKQQNSKTPTPNKKKQKKSTVSNDVSENWAKYGKSILKIARESAKQAYEYTVSLRSQKLISRFEILDGLNNSLKNSRFFTPSNAMQLRDRIDDEHRAMLNKIYKNPYTATDSIAKLLRTGQIGEFITEDEVDSCIVDFVILSLYKLDIKNIDILFADIVAYRVHSLEYCKKFANNIQLYRKIAIDRLCARNNFSDAKSLAMLEYRSKLIILKKDSKKLDEIVKNEARHIEFERIRLAEEERKKEEAAALAMREAERLRLEQIKKERERIKREEIEREARRRKELTKRNSYQAVVQRRNIKELIHFTRIENVRSILIHGIIPRDSLPIYCPYAITNDSVRYDGHTDASCLSVSFPNYKMFYAYQNSDLTKHWAVLSLKPELLWDLNVNEFYFYPSNAAGSSIKCCPFDSMFGNSSLSDPEDAQAEILAFGTISPKHISKVYVKNESDKEFILSRYPTTIPIEVNVKYFKYREKDYK